MQSAPHDAIVLAFSFSLPRYLQVHQKIRAEPVIPKKERKVPAEKKRWHLPKSTYEERKQRLKEKLATLMEAGDE